MNFRIQIKNKIVTTSYKSTTNIVLYGARQGTENGVTKWNFLSVPMMEVVEEKVLYCVIELPKEKQYWTIHILICVDDKRHYSDKFQQNANVFLLKTIEKSVNT